LYGISHIVSYMFIQLPVADHMMEQNYWNLIQSFLLDQPRPERIPLGLELIPFKHFSWINYLFHLQLICLLYIHGKASKVDDMITEPYLERFTESIMQSPLGAWLVAPINGTEQEQQLDKLERVEQVERRNEDNLIKTQPRDKKRKSKKIQDTYVETSWFFHACLYGHKDHAKVIFFQSSKFLFTNCYRFQKILREDNFDVNSTSINGNNALHIAVAAGQREILQILLSNQKHKISLDATNDEGKCALDLAASAGRWDLAQMILKCKRFKWSLTNIEKVTYFAVENER
jgi:hypothetical protein